MNGDGSRHVERLLQEAFEHSGREWRSYEYKEGARAVLEFRYERKAPILPYTPGTPAADAFLGGMEEGWSLLSRFATASRPVVSAPELHLWIEEQRVKVIENLRRAPAHRQSGLTRELHVIEIVSGRVPGRPARYPWESAEQTPNSQTTASAEEVGAGEDRHSAGAEADGGRRVEMPSSSERGRRPASGG
jgi:hypothetical protein